MSPTTRVPSGTPSPGPEAIKSEALLDDRHPARSLGTIPWIDLILLAWFALTALSVAYVAWDAWRNNPELTVMKWGWVLVTLYLGPIGLAIYVLSCKEPAAGTHERFIQPLWKQGSDQRSTALQATQQGSSWPRRSRVSSGCQWASTSPSSMAEVSRSGC